MDQQFYFLLTFAALASVVTKLSASLIAMAGRDSIDQLFPGGAAGPLAGVREKPVL